MERCPAWLSLPTPLVLPDLGGHVDLLWLGWATLLDHLVQNHKNGQLGMCTADWNHRLSGNGVCPCSPGATACAPAAPQQAPKRHVPAESAHTACNHGSHHVCRSAEIISSWQLCHHSSSQHSVGRAGLVYNMTFMATRSWFYGGTGTSAQVNSQN